MTPQRSLRLSGLAAVLLLASACYTYRPVEHPAPGTPVRVGVPLASPLTRPNQAPETVTFEGRLLSLADTVMVETRSRREMGAFREIFELDTLRVATSNITLMEERLLSKPRTYAFTAVVTAGAALLGIAAMNTLTGESGDPNPPGDGGNPQGQFSLNPIVSGLLKLVGR